MPEAHTLFILLPGHVGTMQQLQTQDPLPLAKNSCFCIVPQLSFMTLPATLSRGSPRRIDALPPQSAPSHKLFENPQLETSKKISALLSVLRAGTQRKLFTCTFHLKTSVFFLHHWSLLLSTHATARTLSLSQLSVTNPDWRFLQLCQFVASDLDHLKDHHQSLVKVL